MFVIGLGSEFWEMPLIKTSLSRHDDFSLLSCKCWFQTWILLLTIPTKLGCSYLFICIFIFISFWNDIKGGFLLCSCFIRMLSKEVLTVILEVAEVNAYLIHVLLYQSTRNFSQYDTCLKITSHVIKNLIVNLYSSLHFLKKSQLCRDTMFLLMSILPPVNLWCRQSSWCYWSVWPLVNKYNGFK